MYYLVCKTSHDTLIPKEIDNQSSEITDVSTVNDCGIQ
jgi:hypothetical protein